MIFWIREHKAQALEKTYEKWIKEDSSILLSIFLVCAHLSWVSLKVWWRLVPFKLQCFRPFLKEDRETGQEFSTPQENLPLKSVMVFLMCSRVQAL